MADYDHHHHHLRTARRPRLSSNSVSPVRVTSAIMDDRERYASTRSELQLTQQPPSPPRPAPSSRMSLSALVNSPPPSPPKRTTHVSPPKLAAAAAASESPSSSHYAYPASATSSAYPRDYYRVPPDVGRSYLHREDVKDRAPMERSASFEAQRYDDQPPHPAYDDEYDSVRGDPRRSGYNSSYRSPSPPAHPTFRPYEPTEWSNGRRGASPRAESSNGSRRSIEPPEPPVKEPAVSVAPRKGGMMRPDDSLAANEEVWQEHLRQFQQRRELEAFDLLRWTPEMGDGRPKKPAKAPVKRKGWPSDHPTRIAQRQAKEAALAAGIDIPKKKYKRKSKASAAAIDDELLGLAEGDVAASSPVPASSVADAEERDEHIPIPPSDSIVLPCGLTRAEVITKVESGNIEGLTEDDVKQVQDEMWLKKNGPAALRKDGTMRKKPGPAKGWKAMRKALTKGEESDGESTVNGEAEAEIAALLEDPVEPSPKPKPKKRRGKKLLSAATVDEEIASELGEEIEGGAAAAEEELENGHAPKKARTAKAKEPGVGKGRWTRPPKEKDVKKEQGDEEEEAAAAAAPEVVAPPRVEHVPNTVDPRGVSESEAKVRLNLVEELQRQAWVSIVRDVPKIYRVNQAYDNAIKQDCMRTAQAAVRNGFGQRNLKPSHRSGAKTNKDAVAKAKKIMREMLVYWKKNEKDELAARKRAEKEAMEKAKAEEERRESKRQARKLNFLLTQTELYSHFIGKKIKTTDAEDMGDGDVTPAAPLPEGAEFENDSGDVLPELDYDDDDDENLRRHAARGAQEIMMATKAKARDFDQGRAKPAAELDDDTMDGDELNFQNPTMGEDQITVTQPKMLMAQLKEYQLKGLTWLGNLYEQGINGILADEMGLGKTIQSISLLAYLAEVHNLWGPFLVIAPASTLHNWQQELARFVPRLKALPYWGSPKDRETLRKIWNRKNQTFNEDSQFHILVTSYQLAVQDEKYFQMMRWQYMILDEAQAIKSASSARWKSLLSLNCRNRLLLTGTPIQNSMHELWALLHFIMPSLFDSHEEFSEWFSKDIENAATKGDNATLKPEQLKRLHMILKPFMLRRIKKHVQKELGDKIEIDVLVDLSQRQREIYKALRKRVPIAELIAQASNGGNDSAGTTHLMNLVMQFRKVCNHPDLFERQDVASPLLFGSFSQSGNLARQGDNLYCPASARNAIEVQLPKLVWTDGGKLDVPSEKGHAGSDTHILGNLLNIWSTDWINASLKEDNSQFGFLRVLDLSPGQAHRHAKAHPLVKMLDDANGEHEYVEKGPYTLDKYFAASSTKKLGAPAPELPTSAPEGLPALRDISNQVWNESFLSRRDGRFATDRAVAPAVVPVISNRSFLNAQERLANDPMVQTALYGVSASERNDPAAVAQLDRLVPGVPPTGLLGASPASQTPISTIRVPPPQRLIIDSAKLARLDELLRELKDGGHRVLLYFQMTKMMDLIEEYLIYRQYKYLRLDGSSPIGERRDMVTSWQTNPDFFIFCLSTRAGGLGINLTAADTVIFYDHDWNPSNDAQAMDRAHRVGQTKQVTVYRLIARGTIEERIVQLARAKKDVQDIVVGTKNLNDVAKPAEIASLFMDDEELAESVAKRKQAEAHGFVALAPERKSTFGDGLNVEGDEEDDFFTAKPKASEEDEDVPSGAGTPVPRKRKGEAAGGKKKRVKIALGPDGLPI